MKQSEKKYKRIVVKIGSSLLYSANKVWDDSFVYDIAHRQIASLVKEGNEVIVVSSGAIAFGMRTLGLKERPRKLEDLQATAAIGQNKLMDGYRGFFGKGYFSAQILLTNEDFANRKRYLNARNTLQALLKKQKHCLQHIVPIINENDTISTDEIKFGDNDRLSALVSSLISADLLIILSDVDGLLDKDKKVIPVVDEINSQIKALACPTDKKICVGGMITKIEAAKICMDSGIPCVIANGRTKDIILSVIKEPEKYGTLFSPKKGLAARERWIAFGTKAKGSITVDDGAKKALMNKKSLLAVGILATHGVFESADIVSVADKENCEFARGKVNLSSRHLDKVKGTRHDREVIHRDNIVILQEK
ncbi:MAG: glutamate 5-kinase [Candidatus Omnitrophica bacterium]|nr:glutamate 5-kinase [Candidatus Omnitrophota bacterium]MDD5591991.1 glutamate 5-kinase [Candidatus Omnitrophota bacterium]